MSIELEGETPGITLVGEGGQVSLRVVTGSGCGGGPLVGVLDDLSDVDTTSDPPDDNDVLAFDAESGLWTPATLQGGGGGDSLWSASDDGITAEGLEVVDGEDGPILRPLSDHPDTELYLVNGDAQVVLQTDGSVNVAKTLSVQERVIADGQELRPLPSPELEPAGRFVATDGDAGYELVDGPDVSGKLDATDVRVPPTPVGQPDGHVLTVDDDGFILAAPGGGGGTWEVISATTLGSAAASVELTGLANFRVMRLLIQAKSTEAGTVTNRNVIVRFNGDTGSNYQNNTISDQTFISVGQIPTQGWGWDSWHRIDIANLSAGRPKNLGTTHQVSASAAQGANGGVWINTTDLISSIQLSVSTGGDFAAGSYFEIHGVAR